jgi:hypothetical protein
LWEALSDLVALRFAQLRRNLHHPCSSISTLPSAEEECYDFACYDNACPCGEHTHGDAGCHRLSTDGVSVPARVGASLRGCTTLSQRDGVSSETPHKEGAYTRVGLMVVIFRPITRNSAVPSRSVVTNSSAPPSFAAATCRTSKAPKSVFENSCNAHFCTMQGLCTGWFNHPNRWQINPAHLRISRFADRKEIFKTPS